MIAFSTLRWIGPTSAAVSPNIVVSQVYGGAGCGTAGCSTYKNDYIELFNRGTSAVSLNGWTVQYAAATGTAWQTTALANVSLQPGQYYLVAESAGANGVNNLPTPDTTGTIAMSATAAKVAVVNTTTALSGACPTSATIVDLIGYGATANCFETAVAPAPSTTTADVRAGGGCTDSDNNSTDFTAPAPNPRNTSTALNPCSAATPTLTLNINDVTQAEGNSGTTNFNFTVSLTSPAPAGGVTFNASTADGTTNPATAGSDYVALTNQPFTITAGNTSTTVTVTVNGDTTTEPNETFFVNISNVTGAIAGDTQGLGTITNDDVTVTPIYNIQGSGSTSPLVGQSVSTTGIVTATKPGSSGGFFIQDPTGDGNTATSDGIFVFTGGTLPAGAVVGNNVQVSGTVQEFIPSTDPFQHPETELSGSPTVSVISTGNTRPAPTVITAADTQVNNLDNLEKYEGMRVIIPSLTVVAPTQGTINEPNATVASNGVFYGVVTGVPRPFREPGINISDPLPAGAPANVPRFDENPERIRVSSNGLTGTSVVDVPAGVVLTNLTGPLDFGFRTYTILPETTITLPPTLPTAVAVPTPTSSEFTIASFNMERFFDTVVDAGESGAPTLTATAFNNRLNKASLIIRNVQHYPDVIGVEEMENLSTLQAVASKINSDAQSIDGLPNPNYTAYLSEGNDVGGIDVGFLVKASRVTVVDVTQYGKDTVFTNPDSSTALLNDRPPLVLRATMQRPGGLGALPFTVIVNHLRSLNGVDSTVAGTNGWATEGDRVRAKRRAQAEYLANLIQARQTADPTEKIISVGDYNAFQVNDGYVDVIGTIKGTPAPADQVVLASSDLVNPDLTDLVDTLPADQRYSYSFDGNAQVLDHELINPNMMSILSRFAYARDDADFPVKYYEDGTRPERISDHDQPVAFFNLVAQPQLVISEFRFRGPGVDATSAANNEFVELFNNTSNEIIVSTTDNSAGWSLVGADGTVRFTIPNNTHIPARGHYLATNSNGYSLGNYPAGYNGTTPTTATGDITYSLDIPDASGIALFRTANSLNFNADNRLDAAGYSGVPQLYREGAGFIPGGNETTSNLQYSYYRDLSSGSPKDTNDNLSDFFAVDTQATATGQGQHLGAPGPENSTSPVARSQQVRSSLFDPGSPSSSPPNRVRDFTGVPGFPNGTLTIRRTFRNNSASNITRLRFRIIDITTAPIPSSGTADIRAITSGDTTAMRADGSSDTVNGTTLEQPPTQSIGGGYNSSLSTGTITLNTPLAPSASINLQFQLGVATPGSFRFFITVEALP
ncbi:MAG: uncharacterized protein QOE33_2548 [Acidobacteriota bacterium]|nr:uncharacterized protein [Acidobacteriota bacterium]